MRAPSRRTPSRMLTGRFHSASSCCTTNGLAAKSICGLSTAECSDGANWPCRICINTLVSAAMPAALSQWPIFDLTEPMAQNCRSCVCSRKARLKPAISIGSPSEVPVPCASR